MDLTPDQTNNSSKRHLGLLSGISLIVGSVVGSGIFVSPREVISKAGSLGLSLIIWVVGGLVCIPGALCYAELGCMIPSSGGDYTYIKEGFGDMMGFLRIWSEVIVTRPCIFGVNSITVVEYLVYPLVGECISKWSLKLFACVGILSITALNIFSMRGPMIFQNIGTVGKIAALIVIIICGLVQIAKGRYSEFITPFQGTSSNAASVAIAFYAGLFPYTGWNYLNNAVEELQNPSRNLPLAIFISLAICICVYALTFASYFTALTVAEVKVSKATAVAFIERVFHPLSYVLPFFVALSALGGLNGNMFSISRMFFVAGRDGLFPMVVATKQFKFDTPIIACLFEGILGCFYVFIGDVNQLLNYLSFTYWLVCLFAVISLLIIRKKSPKPPNYEGVDAGQWCPFVFIVLIGLLTLIGFIGSPKEFLIGFVFLLSGIPVYIIMVLSKKSKQWAIKSRKITIFIQKSLNCSPEQ